MSYAVAFGRLAIIFVRFLVAWGYSLGIGALACLLALVIGPQRMWLTICNPWARGTLWLVGVRLHVSGQAHLRGPAIFIVNHESLIDVVFMPAILPRTTHFVAKKSLRWIPLWGWALAASGAVLVDRARPRQALASLRAGLARLPPGWGIIVFPEGTRPSTPRLGRFKKGAFVLAMESGLPMVPIGMVGARAVVPPDGWLVRGGDVHLHVGAPIPTTAWRPDSLADHVATGFAAVEACIAQAAAARAAHPRH